MPSAQKKAAFPMRRRTRRGARCEEAVRAEGNGGEAEDFSTRQGKRGGFFRRASPRGRGRPARRLSAFRSGGRPASGTRGEAAREKNAEKGEALCPAQPLSFFSLYARYMRQAFPALRDGREAHRGGAGGTRARPARNASILRRRRAAFAPFCRNFIRRRQGNPESLYGALRFSLQREKRRNARRDGADAGFGGNGPACGAYSVFTK